MDEEIQKDPLDHLADSLEILDFTAIEKWSQDGRLTEPLRCRAKQLHKMMLDHLFRNNLPSPFDATEIMIQLKLLELDCYMDLIQSAHISVFAALTSSDPVVRRAGQLYYQKTRRH